MQTKSILTIAIAAAALAIGSLAATGQASAKGVHGGKHGGFHGQFHRGHRWHGHRWHGRYFYAPAVYGAYDPCYLTRKPSGRLVKICPVD